MTDKLFIPRKGWARSLGDVPYRDELANYLAIERWANSLKAGGGKEYATVVVAAADTHASGKAFADYVCTGTNDQETVQQALDAASALGGGKVLLLEGTYTFDYNPTRGACIRPGSNTWLCGSGAGTVITFPYRDDINLRVVHIVGSVSNVTVSDIRFVALAETANGWRIIQVDGSQVLVHRCFFTGEHGPCVYSPFGSTTAAHIVVSDCVGSGQNAIVESHEADVAVVNCTYTKQNTSSFLLRVSNGVVANCTLLDTTSAGLDVLDSSSPLVVANTVITRTGPGGSTGAFSLSRPSGGPFLAVNCAFGSPDFSTAGDIYWVTGPTQFINCAFRSNSTWENVSVRGPVTSPGYVNFEGCLFDRRGASGVNANLRLGDATFEFINNVSIRHCTFLADTNTSYNIDISTSRSQNTIVIGNLFRGSIGTGHVNNAGTNTQLTLPTGPLGNNFAL